MLLLLSNDLTAAIESLGHKTASDNSGVKNTPGKSKTKHYTYLKQILHLGKKKILSTHADVMHLELPPVARGVSPPECTSFC